MASYAVFPNLSAIQSAIGNKKFSEFAICVNPLEAFDGFALLCAFSRRQVDSRKERCLFWFHHHFSRR